MTLADIVSWIMLLLGGFLCVSGALGVMRFPDFFTRMHAAGVTDTLGSGLLIVGLMIQAGSEWLVLVKLVFIILFIGITSPTASHALAKAALHAGMKPFANDAADTSEKGE